MIFLCLALKRTTRSVVSMDSSSLAGRQLLKSALKGSSWVLMLSRCFVEPVLRVFF